MASFGCISNADNPARSRCLPRGVSNGYARLPRGTLRQGHCRHPGVHQKPVAARNQSPTESAKFGALTAVEENRRSLVRVAFNEVLSGRNHHSSNADMLGLPAEGRHDGPSTGYRPQVPLTVLVAVWRVLYASVSYAASIRSVEAVSYSYVLGAFIGHHRLGGMRTNVIGDGERSQHSRLDWSQFRSPHSILGKAASRLLDGGRWPGDWVHVRQSSGYRTEVTVFFKATNCMINFTVDRSGIIDDATTTGSKCRIGPHGDMHPPASRT